MFKLGILFHLALISFSLVALGQAQEQKGGISSDLQQRLSALEDSPISLPALILTGRVAELEKAALHIGLKDVGGAGSEAPNAVVNKLYLSVAKLETERNEVISAIRKKEFFGKLGESFLNAVFDKMALDPTTGNFIKGFDKAFVRERAAKNDIASVSEWRVIRDLLLSGEMVFLDDAKLLSGGKVRPEKFDQLYPTYRDAAEKLLAELRKFDQTLPARAGKLQEQFATEYFESYADNVTSLKQESLTALSEVKITLESEKLRNLIVSHLGATPATGALGATPTKPTPTSPAENTDNSLTSDIPTTEDPLRAPATFPLPDPKSLPPLPNVNCRIVVVKMPNAKPDVPLNAYQAIERDDYTDMVKLGEVIDSGNVLAIKNNGQPVLWDKKGKRNTPSRAQAVVAYDEPWLGGIFWIDHSGEVQCDRDVKGSFKRDLEALKNVVRCDTSYSLIFLITADGKRHLLGEGKDHANIALAWKDPETIISAKFGGPNYASVLKNNGSVTLYMKEKRSKFFDQGKYIHQHSFGIFAGNDGLIHGGDASEENMLLIQKLNSPIRSVVVVGGGSRGIWVFQLEDRSWRIMENQKSVNSSWRRNELLEKALEGAAQINPQRNGYIFALLPADAVPRSGLWELDELIAARRK